MRVVRSPWGWALCAVLLVALGLRLASIRFGLPGLNDPDELMFEMGAIRMLRGLTLNPGWFGHPATTTMYLLALVNALVFITGWMAGWFPSLKAFGEAVYGDPSWIILPGRIMMTLFALGTIFLTARMGERLFDRRTALLAAGVLALSPVHITWSQIIRSDMMACFFLLLCVRVALNTAERDRRRDYVLGSLWAAAATVTKWPFALSGLAMAGAVTLLLLDGRLSPRQALARLLAMATMTLLFVVLLSPYLVLAHRTVMRNLVGEGQARHLGSTGGALGENIVWYLSGPLATGLSVVGLLLVPLGGVFLWRERRARFILLPIAAAFFVLLCAQTIVWERWALPLLPVCALAVALAIIRLGARISRTVRPFAVVAVLAAIAIPMLLRDRTDARERLNDTRQIAAAWARAHIRPGSTVLVEHFAFDLLPQPWHFWFPIGDAGCVDVVALLHGQTSYSPIDKARAGRAIVDYGTMAPDRRRECRPDYAILTQYDRYRRERAAFPAEFAAYQELIGRGRVAARFLPQAGSSGGPAVTVVVFPQPGRSSTWHGRRL